MQRFIDFASKYMLKQLTLLNKLLERLAQLTNSDKTAEVKLLLIETINAKQIDKTIDYLFIQSSSQQTNRVPDSC